MHKKTAKIFEVTVVSINYVIISYALTNMAFLFRANLLYILFFASEIWVAGNYWRKMRELTESKIITGISLVLCFVIHIALIYFIGYVSGSVIPFTK